MYGATEILLPEGDLAFSKIRMCKAPPKAIWIGSCWDATNEFIKLKNIDRVVCTSVGCALHITPLHSFLSGSFSGEEVQDKLNAEVLHFDINDDPNENILILFDKANEFIDGGKRIMVHCDGGISRSPSFVIAYLMWKYGYEIEKAINIVNEKRKILPNRGFMNQLKTYYQIIHGSLGLHPEVKHFLTMGLRPEMEDIKPLNIILKLPKKVNVRRTAGSDGFKC